MIRRGLGIAAGGKAQQHRLWAGVPASWAPLLVGVGLLLVAMVIFYSAKSALTNIGFMPARTARNVRADAEAAKDAYNDK